MVELSEFHREHQNEISIHLHARSEDFIVLLIGVVSEVLLNLENEGGNVRLLTKGLEVVGHAGKCVHVMLASWVRMGQRFVSFLLCNDPLNFCNI